VSYLSNPEITAMLEEVRAQQKDIDSFTMSVAQATALLEEVRRTRLIAAEVEKRKLGHSMPVKSFDLYNMQMACWEGDDYNDTD